MRYYQEASREAEKADAKCVKSVTNEAKFALESQGRRAERFQFERIAAVLRSTLYDEPYKTIRTLKARRNIVA